MRRTDARLLSTLVMSWLMSSALVSIFAFFAIAYNGVRWSLDCAREGCTATRGVIGMTPTRQFVQITGVRTGRYALLLETTTGTMRLPGADARAEQALRAYLRGAQDGVRLAYSPWRDWVFWCFVLLPVGVFVYAVVLRPLVPDAWRAPTTPIGRIERAASALLSPRFGAVLAALIGAVFVAAGGAVFVLGLQNVTGSLGDAASLLAFTLVPLGVGGWMLRGAWTTWRDARTASTHAVATAGARPRRARSRGARRRSTEP
ncbi:MAG: hypothetical protein MUF00_10695 [Gemmatimonadaceae bacterium]|jgi:hypothetical protein|nr:hypothetical protein [Gemmatimonadaceae bacterium]